MIKKLIVLLGLLLALCIALFGATWFYSQQYIKTSVVLNKEQLFTVPVGTNAKKLGLLLEQAQVINHKDAWLLPYVIRFYPQYHNFKAGIYALKTGMTIDELLLLLVSGKEAQFIIQFVEGKTLNDWRNILKNAPYIQQTLNGLSNQEIATKLGIEQKNPEGWFYPDSYKYTANTTDLAILKRAYDRMKVLLNEQWQNRDTNLPYRSAYEMLTMASIIEKETGQNDERQLVSSVFVNRLKKGMRLQTDPTVIYGMGEAYNGNITRKDLTTPTPYNTYVISGLTPTPIAMPGLNSLRAAAHPAESRYLFFVADGNGRHVFTSDLTSHNKAVQNYLRIMREKQQAASN